MKSCGVIFACATALWISFSHGHSSSDRPCFKAVEINPESAGAELFYFSRPAALAGDKNCLYVLDSEEAEVRIFSRAGAFRSAFGRRGKGPGEFDMPGDLDVLGDRIYIADGANRRIQILDKKGNSLGGFRVPFFPRNIIALDEERIVVAHLPRGFSGKEKLVHCYSAEGGLLWAAEDSYFSGDAVYDAMRNEVFLKKGGAGSFFIIKRCNSRILREMNRHGEVTRDIAVSRDYSFQRVLIPAAGGHPKELLAFCWNCARHDGKFYLLIPEKLGKRDLGPGRQAAVVNEAGDVEAVVDFPVAMSKIVVEDAAHIQGLDTEGRLRFFALEKK